MIPPPRLAVNGVENALRERIKVAGKRQKVPGTENRNSRYEVL